MYRCDIISWLVRLPTFEPSVLEPRATFEPGPKGLREPKATLESRVPKCMYGCDIISWLVRLPKLESRATFEPRATFKPLTGPKGLREPKATLELRVSNRSVLIPAYIYWSQQLRLEVKLMSFTMQNQF